MIDLKRFREDNNIKQSEICEVLGIVQPYLSAIERGIRPLNAKRFDILYKHYGDIILKYKLADGYVSVELLKNTLPDEIIRDARYKPIEEFIKIPLVQARAMASYLRGYGDEEYIEHLPTVPVIVDRNYKGKYICFECDSDSMDDGSRNSICDKDIVLGRQVAKDLWRYKLHYNDWYFIIVHREGIVIKQITGHDVENGIIQCHSLNQLYEDFELHLDDVIELFNVIKIVDRSVRL